MKIFKAKTLIVENSRSRVSSYFLDLTCFNRAANMAHEYIRPGSSWAVTVYAESTTMNTLMDRIIQNQPNVFIPNTGPAIRNTYNEVGVYRGMSLREEPAIAPGVFAFFNERDHLMTLEITSLLV